MYYRNKKISIRNCSHIFFIPRNNKGNISNSVISSHWMGVKSRHSSKYRHGLNFIVQCRPFEKHGADVLLCGGPASNAANLRMQRGLQSTSLNSI